MIGLLVHWCFEPSQPLGIISGLNETFTKRQKVGVNTELLLGSKEPHISEYVYVNWYSQKA